MPLAIVSTSAFLRLMERLDHKIRSYDIEPDGIEIKVVKEELKWEGMPEDYCFSMHCTSDFTCLLLKSTIKNAILILQRVVDHPATVYFDDDHTGFVFKHLFVM